jgi:antitoxin HicB
MNYHFKVHKAREGGFWAECLELNGCHTQADTREELERNMAEALEVFLDEPVDSKAAFPAPRKRVKGRNIVAVAVPVRLAFASMLRSVRIRRRLTQKRAAELIGSTGSLNNYQRLEKAKTANPELETLARIKKAFPEFELDELV